jgi:predicted nucleotidyltransferase
VKKKRPRKLQTLDEILKVIRKHLSQLKEMKVRHLTVFGSFARGEQRASSDIDLLIEFSEAVGFFHFYDVKTFLEKILGREVDLVVEDAIRPEFHDQIKREMVRAS